MQDAFVVAPDLEEFKAAVCQEHLLIRSGRQDIFKNRQAQVETFLFLDAGPVTVVQPHQHLVNVEIDAQIGLLAITRVIEEHQRLGQTFQKRMGRRFLLGAQCKVVTVEQPVAAEGAFIHLANTQRQLVAQTRRIAQTFAPVDGSKNGGNLICVFRSRLLSFNIHASFPASAAASFA